MPKSIPKFYPAPSSHNTPDPIGFGFVKEFSRSGIQAIETSGSRQKEIKELRDTNNMRQAWSLATTPIKNSGIQLFMLWMGLSGVFTPLIIIYSLFRTVTGIFNVNKASR